jgi:homoserine kinase
MASVTIRVPASTTNFGPGFDCFGAALQLWNYVRLENAAVTAGPAMALEAAEVFFAQSGIGKHPIRVTIQGHVPQARGLGSSVTLRLGTLLALNGLHHDPLDAAEIFRLCAGLENHPDNAAAACFGGFVIARNSGNRVSRFDVDSKVRFVLFVPELELKTSDARRVLPQQYPQDDVVQNLANASLIAAAFAGADYEALRGCFADRVHQPYREPLIPILSRVIAAGESAGALGGFLSGSGSTIACIATREPEEIANAMTNAAAGFPGSSLILGVDNEGARVTSPVSALDTLPSEPTFTEGQEGHKDGPI